MFIIDWAHGLATQEILLHVRRLKQPSSGPPDRRCRRWRPSGLGLGDHADDGNSSQPATASSRDRFLSAMGRRRGPLDYLGRDGDVGGDEGPIGATPVGVVRPWPGEGCRRGWRRREEEVGEAAGRGEALGGEGGEKELLAGGGEQPSSGNGKLSGRNGRLATDGSDTDEGPIIETPMGRVRPTRMRSTRPTKRKTDKDMTKPADSLAKGERRGSDLEEKPATTKTPARTNPQNDAKMSSTIRAMTDTLLLGDRHRVTGPPINTNLQHRRPPPPTSSKQPAAGPPPPKTTITTTTTTTTTTVSNLRNITTLTLLTEDVPALTVFYTTALGATLAPSSSSTTTILTFTPHLSIRLLDSRAARDRAAFGESVTVGRQAGAPKRVLLGVEVRDVDAVWRRLRALGHGWETGDDGQEALGEVRVGEGERRQFWFVDLAGHCWEVWERVEGEGDGQ